MARLINPADIEFFLALANACSITKTARELGVTPAAVSKHLSLMESRIGIPLFNRTTRSMSARSISNTRGRFWETSANWKTSYWGPPFLRRGCCG